MTGEPTCLPKRRWKALTIASTLATAGSEAATDQDATLEQQAPNATPLMLREDPELLSRRVANVEATGSPTGQRFRRIR